MDEHSQVARLVGEDRPPTEGAGPPPLSDSDVEAVYSLVESRRLPLADWGIVLGAVVRRRHEDKWLLMEVLAYGRDKFGDESYQFTDTIDLSEQTQANYAVVGRRWPRSRRAEFRGRYGLEVPLAYAEATAKHWLPEEEAEEIVVYALRRQWDRETLREVLREIHPPRGSGGDGLGEFDPDTGIRTGGWYEWLERELTRTGTLTLLPGVDDGNEDPPGVPPAVSVVDTRSDLAAFIQAAIGGVAVDCNWLAGEIEGWVKGTEDGHSWARSLLE